MTEEKDVTSGNESQTPSTPPPAKRSSPTRRVLVGILVAALFGGAGYMITPPRARSELQQTGSDLREAQHQLQLAEASRRTLTGELTQARSELGEAKTELDRLTRAEADLTAQVGNVGGKVASLTDSLEASRGEVASLKTKLSDLRRTASRSDQSAVKARTLASELQKKLAQAVEQRDTLARNRQRLEDEKARLTGQLNEQQKLSTDLTRLLGVLEIGKGNDTPAPTAAPAEKPITVKEIRYWLGPPTVIAQKGSALTIHWGSKHTAEAVDGVVTRIDGKDATRGMLSDLAAAKPVPANVEWRLATDEPVRYVDLLTIFGPPAGVTGTGNEFSAWWSVGAWARDATARIVNGVVTEFDGREVDPDALCELVRHRADAYRTPNHIVATSARACYDLAGKKLQAYLDREAELMARDGWTLQEWKLADFNSVGTWIAPTSTPADAMTLRAAVDCKWVAGDGRVNVQRRYLVVTMGTCEAKTTIEDFALFAPRD